MLQCVAGDGTISAVFDSEAQFEAVAFVVDKNTTAGGGQTSGKDNQTTGKNDQSRTNGTATNSTATNSTATNSKVSPKTGENTVIPVVMFAAIALLAAGTYCLRKRETR